MNPLTQKEIEEIVMEEYRYWRDHNEVAAVGAVANIFARIKGARMDLSRKRHVKIVVAKGCVAEIFADCKDIEVQVLDTDCADLSKEVEEARKSMFVMSADESPAGPKT